MVSLRTWQEHGKGGQHNNMNTLIKNLSAIVRFPCTSAIKTIKSRRASLGWQDHGKNIILLFIFLAVCLLDTPVYADNWRFSVGVNESFSTGRLGIGVNNPPLGESKDHAQPISFTGRVIYNKWSWKPAAEFTYKQAKYDVSTSRAVITLDPREYSIRAGLIKEVFGVELIALAGYTLYRGNLQVIERKDDGSVLVHGGVIGNVVNTPSLRLGIAKLIPLTDNIKWGLEGGVEYYFIDREYNYCMKFKPDNIEPYIGMKFEF